ncbi:MAG: hypothetical protein ACYS9T_06775 [Planctomycetota bacterium]
MQKISPQKTGGAAAMAPPIEIVRAAVFRLRSSILFLAVYLCLTCGAWAGPYTEVGVNGYIGEDRRHANPLSDADARLNPIFRGWAMGFENYLPADDVWSGDWDDPTKSLGPVTGNNFDVVSLGDLSAAEISAGQPPGEITLVFGNPSDANDANHIRDVNGYDFAVFENGFLSNYNTGGGSVQGQMLAELAYVEVSSNGVDFVRFGSVSLSTGAVGPYGTIEVSDVFNLAGKHPNAYGVCTGTAFDLRELANHPLAENGAVDINDIHYVRIVDIPGSGDFLDSAVEHVDPNTWPSWGTYDANHAVYDAWLTEGSGGLDLEAVGVLEEQEYSADINLDGAVDFFDFALLGSAWGKHFGQAGWVGRCDMAEPKDLVIDGKDLAMFADQWLMVEKWR